MVVKIGEGVGVCRGCVGLRLAVSAGAVVAVTGYSRSGSSAGAERTGQRSAERPAGGVVTSEADGAKEWEWMGVDGSGALAAGFCPEGLLVRRRLPSYRTGGGYAGRVGRAREMGQKSLTGAAAPAPSPPPAPEMMQWMRGRAARAVLLAPALPSLQVQDVVEPRPMVHTAPRRVGGR